MASSTKDRLRHAALVAGACLALVIAPSATAQAAGSLNDKMVDCFGNTHYVWDVIYAVSGGAETYGTSGQDVIIGTSGPDVIDGLEASDIICGGDGNDVIHGNADDIEQDVDYIDGENGSDIIYGWGGNDVLRGGALDDTIYGGDGGDEIHGGPGDDTIYGEDGSDTVQCDNGQDYADGYISGADDHDHDSFGGTPGINGGCETYVGFP